MTKRRRVDTGIIGVSGPRGCHGAMSLVIGPMSATMRPCRYSSSPSIRKDGRNSLPPFGSTRRAACVSGPPPARASSLLFPTSRHPPFPERQDRSRDGQRRVERGDAASCRVEWWGAFLDGQSSHPTPPTPLESRFNLYRFGTPWPEPQKTVFRYGIGRRTSRLRAQLNSQVTGKHRSRCDIRGPEAGRDGRSFRPKQMFFLTIDLEGHLIDWSGPLTPSKHSQAMPSWDRRCSP